MEEPADEQSYYDLPELDLPNFPNFWYRCFSESHMESPEYVFRNFLAQAAYTAVKGQRPARFKAMLTMNPEQLIRSLILKRTKSVFPSKEYREHMAWLETELKRLKSAKYKDKDNYSRKDYQRILRQLKEVEQKRDDFVEKHAKLRQFARFGEYTLFVQNALLGELDPDSNVARQGALFTLGYWISMVDEVLQSQVGNTLVEAALGLFDRIVAPRLQDDMECVVVREAIRGSIEILLFLGDYILNFFKSGMFCNYKQHMPGSSPIDENLLLVLPNTKLMDWLWIKRTDTIPKLLKKRIQEIFPLKVDYDVDLATEKGIQEYERKRSARRTIGLATRENRRYRYLALELMKIIKLEAVDGKAAHLQGMYLDRVMYFLHPYLKIFPYL